MKTHQEHDKSSAHPRNKAAGDAAPFFAPLVQPKLKINEPGDPYEQEADAMADRVMRMESAPIPSLQRMPWPIQRQEKPEEEEPVQAKPLAGEHIQRQGDGEEEEEPVQAKPLDIQRSCAWCEKEKEEGKPVQTMPLMRKSAGGGYTASPQLSAQLSQSKGGGSPLPKPTLSFMNRAFGSDFSHVRVHTGSEAQEMSQGIQAKAFTYGSDIYFNRGQYSPDSSEGKRLLAHELVHVGQQGDNLQRGLKENMVQFKRVIQNLEGNMDAKIQLQQFESGTPLQWKEKYKERMGGRNTEDGLTPAWAMAMGRSTMFLYYGVRNENNKPTYRPHEVESIVIKKFKLDGIAGAPPSMKGKVIEVYFDFGVDNSRNDGKHKKGHKVSLLCVDTMRGLGYSHRGTRVIHNIEISPNGFILGAMVSQPKKVSVEEKYALYVYPIYFKTTNRDYSSKLVMKPATLTIEKEKAMGKGNIPKWWTENFRMNYSQLNSDERRIFQIIWKENQIYPFSVPTKIGRDVTEIIEYLSLRFLSLNLYLVRKKLKEYSYLLYYQNSPRRI